MYFFTVCTPRNATQSQAGRCRSRRTCGSRRPSRSQSSTCPTSIRCQASNSSASPAYFQNSLVSEPVVAWVQIGEVNVFSVLDAELKFVAQVLEVGHDFLEFWFVSKPFQKGVFCRIFTLVRRCQPNGSLGLTQVHYCLDLLFNPCHFFLEPISASVSPFFRRSFLLFAFCCPFLGGDFCFFGVHNGFSGCRIFTRPLHCAFTFLSFCT